MTNCLLDEPARPVARLLLAHGAGAPMDSPFMQAMAEHLARENISVVRFEFPFMVKRRQSGKRQPPDRQNVLLHTWQEWTQRRWPDRLPLFIGGKSMGGRMASLWAASQPTGVVRGLVLFGYPFHPAGKPDRLRTEHFAMLHLPTLIVQGERDRLGSSTCVNSLDLPRVVRVHWLADADHDLKPLKRSGFTQEQAWQSAAYAAAAHIKNLTSGPLVGDTARI